MAWIKVALKKQQKLKCWEQLINTMEDDNEINPFFLAAYIPR